MLLLITMPHPLSSAVSSSLTSSILPSSLSLSVQPLSTFPLTTHDVTSTATTSPPPIRTSPVGTLSPSIRVTPVTSQSTQLTPIVSSSSLIGSEELLMPTSVVSEVSMATVFTTVPFSMSGEDSQGLVPFTSSPSSAISSFSQLPPTRSAGVSSSLQSPIGTQSGVPFSLMASSLSGIQPQSTPFLHPSFTSAQPSSVSESLSLSPSAQVRLSTPHPASTTNVPVRPTTSSASTSTPVLMEPEETSEGSGVL